AAAKDARAALILAATYDPDGLRRLGLPAKAGLTLDIAMAKSWYERAVKYGSADASRMLARLIGTAPHLGNAGKSPAVVGGDKESYPGMAGLACSAAGDDHAQRYVCDLEHRGSCDCGVGRDSETAVRHQAGGRSDGRAGEGKVQTGWTRDHVQSDQCQ